MRPATIRRGDHSCKPSAPTIPEGDPPRSTHRGRVLFPLARHPYPQNRASKIAWGPVVPGTFTKSERSALIRKAEARNLFFLELRQGSGLAIEASGGGVATHGGRGLIFALAAASRLRTHRWRRTRPHASARVEPMLLASGMMSLPIVA